MKNNIENELSKFNFESIITIEEILFYFLNDEIKLSKNNIINYYKILHYYLIIENIQKIFEFNFNYSKIFEQLFNYELITVLINGIFIFNQKYIDNDIKKEFKKIIKECMIKNHQNFLLLSQILINELQYNNMTNIYYNKICKKTQEHLKIKILFNNVKEMLLEIERNNKYIDNKIKLIQNLNEKNSIVLKEISQISSIINKFEQKTPNNIFDYCLKVLDIPEDIIKEIKKKTYLSIQGKKGSSKIYHSVKIPFLEPLKKTKNMY